MLDWAGEPGTGNSPPSESSHSRSHERRGEAWAVLWRKGKQGRVGAGCEFQAGWSGKGLHPKGREEVTQKSGSASKAGGAAKVSEQGSFLRRVGGAWAPGLAEPCRKV